MSTPLALRHYKKLCKVDNLDIWITDLPTFLWLRILHYPHNYKNRSQMDYHFINLHLQIHAQLLHSLNNYLVIKKLKKKKKIENIQSQ